MLSQGLAIATGLISVPLTVGYLGQERYGIWLTINSLLMWLAISNLGFGGNALINSLAEANGRDDRELARELVSTAFWSLVGIAASLVVIFALAFPFIPWSAVFNATSSVPTNELHWAVILSLICFALMFPISIVDAVYQSYQRGYIGNVWAMVGSLLSLAALVGVTRIEGGLPLLVLALSGVRIIVTLVNVGYLFGRQYPWLIPAPQAVTRRSFSRLMSLGLKYLAAQLAGIGMFQSQPMIITQILGPAQVGIFNVTQRLLALPLNVVQMFTFPLMPAYGEARARNDWPWIRRTLLRSLIASGAVTLCLTIPLMFLVKPLIRAWVGPEMIPEDALILNMGLYVLIAGIVTPASVVLYGLERVGGQAMIATANALVTVILGILLTRTMGLSGVAGSMAFALFSVNLIGQAFQIRRAFNIGPAEGLGRQASQ
jgi:O-antigen/teichoic acid export membrane protein